MKISKTAVLLLPICFFMSQALGQAINFINESRQLLKPIVLKEAAWAMEQKPLTITSAQAERSAGGKHDFFSEGDYWWPDPQNPNGPYIQRDGITNPDNFTAHRKYMTQFSQVMGALASAFLITNDEKYAKHAFAHTNAWLVDTATRMNPHMLYAQAIQGRFTGRGIGIIDMIQFMEVAQALSVLEKSKSANKNNYQSYRNWFKNYLTWVTTHPYGLDEKNALNNHGTCWTMQVAVFAKFVNDKTLMDTCINRYKYKHLPDQMASDGSFPKELNRTKPYGYSIFNLDAMTMICQILSDQEQNLWTFEMPDGKSISKGIAFLFPFVKDKNLWPFKKDVMYWDDWPVAQPFLYFGAQAFQNKYYYHAWSTLPHETAVEEIIRNVPVRHPLIWNK